MLYFVLLQQSVTYMSGIDTPASCSVLHVSVASSISTNKLLNCNRCFTFKSVLQSYRISKVIECCETIWDSHYKPPSILLLPKSIHWNIKLVAGWSNGFEEDQEGSPNQSMICTTELYAPLNPTFLDDRPTKASYNVSVCLAVLPVLLYQWC